VVQVVSQKAFAILHHPNGWQEVKDEGIEAGRRVMFMASSGGGERWRSEWPAEALRRRHGVRAFSTKAWPLGLEEGDIVIFHRPLSEMYLDAVRAYRDAGVTVLVDEDDDLEKLPSSFDRATREWTANILQFHNQAIREASGLIVSTARLKAALQPLAAQVWVWPNLIPRWVAALAGPREEGPVRIGWAGLVKTHLCDLRWLAPSTRTMVGRAKFTTVGDVRTPATLKVPQFALDRVWGPEKDIQVYYQRMARADIGIVPLAVNEEFNQSKSYIKALEYMMLGKPVVVADLPEQRILVRDGIDGFLASTPKEFAQRVQELVRDSDLRDTMGAAARERARAFSVEEQSLVWKAVIDAAAQLSSKAPTPLPLGHANPLDNGRRRPDHSVRERDMVGRVHESLR
jgi:glycosyltransferase involved in cell wall biosynthesis